jgi:hypothetical protein
MRASIFVLIAAVALVSVAAVSQGRGPCCEHDDCAVAVHRRPSQLWHVCGHCHLARVGVGGSLRAHGRNTRASVNATCVCLPCLLYY